MKVAQQKAAITREIKQLQQYRADVLSTRHGNAVTWLYLGDIVSMYTINNIDLEITLLKRKYSNLSK